MTHEWQKRFRSGAILWGGGGLIVLMVVVGVLTVRAGWIAPASNPPADNVPQPITTGPLLQAKAGNLILEDVWVKEAQRWLGNTWQLRLIDQPIDPPFLLPAVPLSANASAYTSWEIVAGPTGFQTVGPQWSNPPSGFRREIRALIVKAVCRNGYLWLTGEPNPSGPPPQVPTTPVVGAWVTEWRVACGDAAGAYDINTVTVPVLHTFPSPSASSGEGFIKIRLHLDSAGALATFIARPYLVGYYYQDIPLPPEPPEP